jgi:hypothetical protein
VRKEINKLNLADDGIHPKHSCVFSLGNSMSTPDGLMCVSVNFSKYDILSCSTRNEDFFLRSQSIIFLSPEQEY